MARGLRRTGRRRAPRVALAGAGYIAVVHALAATNAGMTVSAVASAGGRSARHLAGELDARRVRPDELPAGADVLIVATPPLHHVDTAIAGLRAGSAVLVEKPVATTLAEADRLVAAVEAAGDGPRARAGENLLHAPAWRELRARAPRLGGLQHLVIRAMQPQPDWGHFAHRLEHGGALFDLGPHPIALALDLVSVTDPDDRVVAVSARLSSTRSDGADDDAVVELTFESTLHAEVRVSWTTDPPVWDLQAASPTGVLRLDLLPEVLLEADGEPIQVALRHDAADPRLEEFGYVDQLLDLVGEQEPTGQSVRGARHVLEVICAAYASAGDGGEPIALPLDRDRSLTPMQLWRGPGD